MQSLLCFVFNKRRLKPICHFSKTVLGTNVMSLDRLTANHWTSLLQQTGIKKKKTAARCLQLDDERSQQQGRAPNAKGVHLQSDSHWSWEAAALLWNYTKQRRIRGGRERRPGFRSRGASESRWDLGSIIHRFTENRSVWKSITIIFFFQTI